MTMESLIPVISKLQDVFATIGFREPGIELPQIVVVGSQSAGKSSVIEGIVGRDFLPRGTGIVTRRPLLLHLMHVPLQDERRSSLADHNGDWAVFEHIPDSVFVDFNAVRTEIETETNRVTGRNKGISPLPINLKIYSHKVVNLSLIDLPGMTKVPVGDQPPDIEIQIRQMICTYIANPNSIILAVTPANQDFATSEPLKIALEYDRDGNRTLAVLTKLDLMDHGTDAMEVLTGKVVPVKLGIVGVVNRSQADIKAEKSIRDCLRDEQKFLSKTYPTLASTNGISYLSKTLNRLLMHHIRECLPQLKIRISTMIQQSQTLLNSYGEPVTDKSRTILQIITNFSNAYTSTIEGTAKNIETAELCGGARICYIFYNAFSEKLDKLNPLEGLTKPDILTAMRNATGTRPSLFIPEVSFELLVKRQIRRLEEPSLQCVDLTYEELLRIVQHCGYEIQQEMERFPKLYDRISEIVTGLLVSRLTPTKEFVSNLVAIQLAYINTRHPEFSETSTLVNALKDPSSSIRTLNLTANGDGGPLLDAAGQLLKTAAATVESPSKRMAKTADAASAASASSRDKMATNDGGEATNTNGVGSSISWLFSRNQGSASANGTASDGKSCSSTTTEVNSSSIVSLRDSLDKPYSQREQRDCEIIERLISSYFKIVRKSIQDLVPKSVMNFLVNNVKENLQNELVRQLYNSPDIDELLSESDCMAQRRKDTFETLKALKKANLVIGEIREAPFW